MITPQQQLTAVAKQVAQWQQTKQYRNSAVPESIRQQALTLFEHFSISELKQTLKLSESLLHKWSKLVKSTAQTPATTLQSQEFVTLPESEPPKSISNNLSLELSVGEQCHIRLTGDISVQQLDVVTRNIFMYQAGVNP